MAPAMATSTRLGAQCPTHRTAHMPASKACSHVSASRRSCVRVQANAPAGSVTSVVMATTLVREPAVLSRTIEVLPSLSSPGKILTSAAPTVVRPPSVVNPVREITSETFQQMVGEDRDSLILVDFFTDWCGPCQLMHKELDKMTPAFTKVKFYKLNCSKGDTNFATHQRIRSLPTFRIYKRGACLEEVTGARPVQLRQALLHHSVMS